MPARFTSLCDETVGAPSDRPASLTPGTDHDEHEHTALREPLDHRPVDPECHHHDVDARVHTLLDVAATHERHQQIHGNGATRRTVTHLPDRLAQIGRRCQPERAQPAGGGDSSGQFGTREPTAHAGLGDRNVEAQPVQ